ncbi:unnamed protein product [Cuscuta europaea]|uniref:Uncharacterized protein n=1 Tax=Cuscuta europaea TaxID=41803 RepID=A0A9P0YRY0_CUSEU|nr:unnamed protein product [Cuscuta europaea]
MVYKRHGFKNVNKAKTVTSTSESFKNFDLDNHFSTENDSCDSYGSENEDQTHVEDLPSPGVCVNDDEKKRRRISNRCDCKARAVYKLAGMNQYKNTFFRRGITTLSFLIHRCHF